MNWLLEIPVEVRAVLVGLCGLVLGGQWNRGIYRLAWHPRDIGPWSPTPVPAARRRWPDFLPIVGWLRLRRESSIHGAGYWVRPLLIELAAAFGLGWLYWYEVSGGLVPSVPGIAPPSAWMLHAQFLGHVLLISLLVVATFIDFDEQTIPDEITVPGTLLGLLLMCLLPVLQPWIPVRTLTGFSLHHLVVTSSQSWLGWDDGLGGPRSWPAWLDTSQGLALGLACFLGWCLAILPKRWTLRRGWRKAVPFLVASVLRSRGTPLVLGIAVLGSAGIVGGWLWGSLHWESLLTALIGLAFGGGLIWAVRIVGGFALRREAMGFGDVTLMAMIGTFVGWQPSLMIFFLAPFAALLISLTQWALTGRKDIAFGPYLSLATVMLLLAWPEIWPGWAAAVFQLGWLIPGLVGACLILMAGLLSCWRVLNELLFAETAEESADADSQR